MTTELYIIGLMDAERDGVTYKVLPTEEYFSMVKKQLSEDGQAFVRVTGNSMQPLLKHLRDGVIIVPPTSIHTGDIVLFDRKNGRYALHRVIRKKQDGFSMAGDNQWYFETGLPYDQIVGVTDTLVRNGKKISCNNIFVKIYAFWVTLLTVPRIYLWRAIVRLGKMIRHPGEEDREEVRE